MVCPSCTLPALASCIPFLLDIRHTLSLPPSCHLVYQKTLSFAFKSSQNPTTCHSFYQLDSNYYQTTRPALWPFWFCPVGHTTYFPTLALKQCHKNLALFLPEEIFTRPQYTVPPAPSQSSSQAKSPMLTLFSYTSLLASLLSNYPIHSALFLVASSACVALL